MTPSTRDEGRLDLDAIKEHAVAVGHWLLRDRLAADGSLAIRLIRDEVPALVAEVASLTAERDRLQAERDEQREQAAMADALADQLAALVDTVVARAHRAEATLERQRPVIEAARAWYAAGHKETGARVSINRRADLRLVLEVAIAALDGSAATPGTCCEFHNRNCEPPSELCCERCTEGAHGLLDRHTHGSECIAPDLSGFGAARRREAVIPDDWVCTYDITVIDPDGERRAAVRHSYHVGAFALVRKGLEAIEAVERIPASPLPVEEGGA